MILKRVIIGFDFSINKPAATILYQGKYYNFIWPLELTKYENEVYSEMSMKNDFKCLNRNLESISKTSTMSASAMVLEHTKRSVELAETIIRDIKKFEDEVVKLDKVNDQLELYIVSEGLSFNSKGNSTLDLATYKAVLMSKIYEEWKDVKIYTYSPMTIKSVAGCSKKDKKGDKHAMIHAFIDENVEDCTFWQKLKDETLSRVNKKGNIDYYHCVDDIVDSYFVIKTLIYKEGIDIVNG